MLNSADMERAAPPISNTDLIGSPPGIIGHLVVRRLNLFGQANINRLKARLKMGFFVADDIEIFFALFVIKLNILAKGHLAGSAGTIILIP